MDNILTTAIVGTGQINKTEIITNTPIDALTQQLRDISTERAFLLSAGAWALYQQAGQIPHIATAKVPPKAPPEILSQCSIRAAYLLTNLLQGEQSELLPEALERLKHARLRIPYELLPQALSYGSRNKELRPALIKVIAERGRWLSQFNSAWAWVTQFLVEETASFPANAETIWQEGTQGQREEILKRLRALEPAKAQAWLQAVWKQEKADARAAFLATFEVGLSTADQDFLEQTISDRGENVRATAAMLLRHLPESSHVQDMIQQVDKLLDYKNINLTVTFPQLGQEWKDAITIARLKFNHDDRTYWLRYALSRVPLKHWEKRFSATPEELIAASQKNEWNTIILDAWSSAALFYHETDWFAPLLEWHNQQLLIKEKDNISSHRTFPTQYREILQRLPQRQAEQIIQLFLTHSQHLANALLAMPGPWSQAFSESSIQELKKHFRDIEKESYDGTLHTALERTALQIHPSCFHLILDDWEIPEGNEWYLSQWRQKIKHIQALVQTRQELQKEIQ